MSGAMFSATRLEISCQVCCHRTSRLDRAMVDDLAGLAGVFESQRYMEIIRQNEASFLDLHACEFLVATENAVIG